MIFFRLFCASAKAVLGAFFWLCFSTMVLSHGAWLGGGGVSLTDASRQQIADRVAAGLPPISAGDNIAIIADFPVIAEGTLDGPGGYATLYVPAGTEVASAYITDATGAASKRLISLPTAGLPLTRRSARQRGFPSPIAMPGWPISMAILVFSTQPVRILHCSQTGRISPL